jgi:hypothetical protein
MTGGDPTRTGGSADEIDGVDGATHNTAAHNPATAIPAASRRHHTETSNMAQFIVIPAFRTDTSWRSILR